MLATDEPTLRKGHGVATFDDLPAGTHTVTIEGSDQASTVRPITSTTLVWPRPTH